MYYICTVFVKNKYLYIVGEGDGDEGTLLLYSSRMRLILSVSRCFSR